MTIQRLDYSQPPPGYTAPVQIGEEWHVVGPGFAENFASNAEALAAAWAHYKAEHDPPGMRVIGTGDADQTFNGVRHFFLSHTGAEENAHTRAEARAAAWAWHDRRDALADRVNAEILDCRYVAADGPIWPRCLTWSDEQVAAVERWLADSTVELPEVLRG